MSRAGASRASGGRLLPDSIRLQVDRSITDYQSSRLRVLVDQIGEPLAIKFVASRWASAYAVPKALKISETPALTWGTGTYVTPLAFPLSSVLYGRIGLVTPFDPTGWRIFDATRASARQAYVTWVRAQPIFDDLVLTVHSTFTNHKLRDKFRKDLHIDCVLFRPDQEAELHTDMSQHVWVLVTDWIHDEATTAWRDNDIATTFSGRLAQARFTVLIDEEFDLVTTGGLPIQVAPRKIEGTTLGFPTSACFPVSRARSDPKLGAAIAGQYRSGSYLHIYVEP